MMTMFGGRVVSAAEVSDGVTSPRLQVRKMIRIRERMVLRRKTDCRWSYGTSPIKFDSYACGAREKLGSCERQRVDLCTSEFHQLAGARSYQVFRVLPVRVVTFVQPLRELDQQFDAALHILEIHDLARGVHVAQRNAN